ncbi:hypothetical protein BZA05DRAFT_79547 [Tricharina praecox]|uniref:uncharacterized protein n=1 Tax=Tricharina praecox TaxID=43433 RepID=UPI00221F0F16|nr:uncharacterized protein BZA05DRAFT_79547 [Tricharina praecox]KAI5849889.1 hypothetical protein BZA05DRAFT_79547 [Tricharina praecox]
MKFTLLAAAAAVALVRAQTTEPDPVTEFCTMGGSSIAISNNIAYIFGGWATYDGYNSSFIGSNDFLRVIDFTKSFRTGADVADYVEMIEMPDIVPRGTFVSFWPTDNNTLDMFHGFHEPTGIQVAENDTAALKVWPLNAKHAFDIATETWSAKTVASADLSMMDIPADNNGAVQKLATRTQVWVPGAKKGFELGGESYMDSNHTNWLNSREFSNHNGLLVYDQATDSWTNETMPLKYMRNGVLAQLQTADDNILIAFGGFTSERGTTNKMRSMREFSIYSTNQARWYSFVVPEGSTIPDTLASSCWTVVSSQDNTSHQIITFGGERTLDAISNNEVWALTIPSFDWVQLEGNATDPTRDPGARTQPICATVGNRYMLTYGGRGSGCDKDGNAVFLLDISQGKWVDDFKTNQEYLVPDAVVAVIGGTGKGGATKLAPSGGFNDAGLEKLLTFNTTTTGSANGTTSSTSDSGSSGSSSSSSNTGAIAGGVVGGLAAIAIVAGIFFMIRRRRQKNELAAQQQLPPGQHSSPIVELKAPLHAQDYHHQQHTQPVEMYMNTPIDPPVELSAGDAHARGFHEAPAYK